jgi:hypothetical protein
MTTSEKYFDALKKLEQQISTPEFNMSKFIDDNKLSHQFGTTLHSLGIITSSRRGKRKKYTWTLADPYSIVIADVIRESISLSTNGRRPKFESKANLEGRIGKTIENGRKPSQNASELIVDEQGIRINRPERPELIDKEKILSKMQSSLFRRLCPECAETMHQLIDLLKTH